MERFFQVLCRLHIEKPRKLLEVLETVSLLMAWPRVAISSLRHAGNPNQILFDIMGVGSQHPRGGTSFRKPSQLHPFELAKTG